MARTRSACFYRVYGEKFPPSTPQPSWVRRKDLSSQHFIRLEIEADIRLNNYSVYPTRVDVGKQVAFVAQDGSLQVTFSAKLCLPRSSTTADELDHITEIMLQQLGLVKCADKQR